MYTRGERSPIQKGGGGSAWFGSEHANRPTRSARLPRAPRERATPGIIWMLKEESNRRRGLAARLTSMEMIGPCMSDCLVAVVFFIELVVVVGPDRP